MNYFLDCWLESNTPSIRVYNKKSNMPILEFKGAEVQTLLDEQIIDLEDLHNKDVLLEQEIIQRLFIHSTKMINKNEILPPFEFWKTLTNIISSFNERHQSILSGKHFFTKHPV
ncbi:MAG: hypothetical protein OQL19_03290 [Gammaproteobacteria bacterium]|nr:hypothetical protein [Gammaproteobacteria bacterium]